jgi:hypothetical protein
MSDYYPAKPRSKNLFDPSSKEPFKLSRSKIDLFMECPRCFYIDRRLGVGRPPGFPFNLNSAVDHLLKKEFDLYRANGTPHPLMNHYGIKAVPFAHEKMDEWRDALRRGVQALDKASNFLITGGLDDIWINEKGELIVVDYKATSKDSEINLDADWQRGYKRQMEVYQWLLRENGFKVSSTGYFVYCNGKRDREAFDAKLEFDISILPYTGETKWIPPALLKVRECLSDDKVPKAGKNCDYCVYLENVDDVINRHEKIQGKK